MHPVCYLFRRHLILKSFIVILSKSSAQKWNHPTALDVDTVVTPVLNIGPVDDTVVDADVLAVVVLETDVVVAIVLGADEILVLAMVDVKTTTSMNSVTIEITIIIRIKIKER